MHDPIEPACDVNDRPCLTLDLPDLSDEAALQLSEFLHSLAEHIESHYYPQILRAYRARECERARLHREQLHLQAQHSLPFSDDPPF
jgi:hypothetical protein